MLIKSAIHVMRRECRAMARLDVVVMLYQVSESKIVLLLLGLLSCDLPDQGTSTHFVRELDVLDPHPHIALELFSCAFEDLELSLNERIVRHRRR